MKPVIWEWYSSNVQRISFLELFRGGSIILFTFWLWKSDATSDCLHISLGITELPDLTSNNCCLHYNGCANFCSLRCLFYRDNGNFVDDQLRSLATTLRFCSCAGVSLQSLWIFNCASWPLLSLLIFSCALLTFFISRWSMWFLTKFWIFMQGCLCFFTRIFFIFTCWWFLIFPFKFYRGFWIIPILVCHFGTSL